MAEKRFINLERWLMNDAPLRSANIEFMRAYERLGHMSVSTSKGAYYIPNHAVVKGIVKLRNCVWYLTPQPIPLGEFL